MVGFAELARCCRTVRGQQHGGVIFLDVFCVDVLFCVDVFCAIFVYRFLPEACVLFVLASTGTLVVLVHFLSLLFDVHRRGSRDAPEPEPPELAQPALV